MCHSFLKVPLFLLLLFVTLTTVAEDNFQRGCRRGTPRTQSVLRRGTEYTQTWQVGGDFYQGVRHQLVIMVTFNDLFFQDDENVTIEKWDKVFNERDYVEGDFVGSIHDYFYDQSYGQFDLRFDLLYIALKDSVKKYRSTGADGDDENSQYLVNDLADVLQTYDIDWGKYDWNGDGFVNQLMIIFPGKGQNNGGGSNSIWPHQWWLSQCLKDRVPNVYCEPRRMICNGKEYWIDCYCALQEIANNKPFGSFGTICHEYTHCFGFPDFYYKHTCFPGEWDLMDYGNNNGSGFCPPNYSAHERWLMGWLTPVELKKDTMITDMPALADEPQAYLIRNDGWENEYYIIENRQQHGWDTMLPGSGITVFHIDYDEDIWVGISNEYANTNTIQHYNIFHANNKSFYDSKGWGYPNEGNNQLTNTSDPAAKLNNNNIDNTYFMNKPITNMKVEEGLASFDFMKDPSAIQTVNSTSVLVEQWFNLQGRQLSGRPQRKGLYINGSCKVVVK